jgi:hypothetical protein
MAKEKVVPEHKDKLGRVLTEGACVAYPSSNSLVIGVIQRFTPKMVEVKSIDSQYSWSTKKYPADLALLEGPDVTFYVLSNTK